VNQFLSPKHPKIGKIKYKIKPIFFFINPIYFFWYDERQKTPQRNFFREMKPMNTKNNSFDRRNVTN